MTQRVGIVTIGEKQWAVTIAETLQELSSGLSGVAQLNENSGMLFNLGAQWPQVEVTAVDMLIPIDVVFIDNELKVCGVKLNLQPGETYLFNSTARFFLEVNAGEASDIEVGDSVSIDGLNSEPDTGTDSTLEQGIGTEVLNTVINLGVNILVITVVISSMFKMFGKITKR